MKHTKGPFCARVSSFNSSVFEVVSPEDSVLTGIPTVPVVAVVHSAYYGPHTAKANADLFAAAPDMLVSLADIRDFLRNILFWDGIKSDEMREKQVQNRIDYAERMIAKAGGAS